jgi:hypothetical protein
VGAFKELVLTRRTIKKPTTTTKVMSAQELETVFASEHTLLSQSTTKLALTVGLTFLAEQSRVVALGAVRDRFDWFDNFSGSTNQVLTVE